MKRFMGYIIKSSERRTEEFMALQVKDSHQPGYGGIRTDILDVKPTVYALATAAAVYSNPDSRYYQNPKLLQAMKQGMDFVIRYQNEDGSFDYPSCNFHSAPDTSFCLKRLFMNWTLLDRYGKEEVNDLKEQCALIIRRTMGALMTGGFHTPNHRWAIAAALLQGSILFGNEEFSGRLKERAGQYLQEGIDCNDDGEYAERSTGNYNAVVNNAMLNIYEVTGDAQYLEYMERNLNMMLTFIDPDDTIFTQNSTRQDKGRLDYPDKYFYQYLYLAAHPEVKVASRAVLDGAAHKIIQDTLERGDLAPDCLPHMMIHEWMMAHTFAGYGFPRTYRRYYAESGVVRVSNPDFCYSILKDQSNFLFFKTGSLEASLGIGESVGSVRTFVADDMRVSEDQKECVLLSEVDNTYYLPWKETPDTSDWWAMDHSKRDIMVAGSVRVQVSVKELADGLEIGFKAEGKLKVPLRIQVCIPAGCMLENEHFYLETGSGGQMVLRDGEVSISRGGDRMSVGPGFGTHEFKGHYSGEVGNTAGYTLCLNDYTPFDRTIYIKAEKTWEHS